MNKKMEVKDYIIAGAYAAIFVILFSLIVTITSITPITYLLEGVISSIVLGTVYMFYITKVQKKGAVVILSVLMGLAASGGMMYLTIVISIIIGIIAELFLNSNSRTIKKAMSSYCIFSIVYVSPFISLLFMKDKFYKIMGNYYSAEYIQTFDKFINPPIVIGLVFITVIVAYIGGKIGIRMAKKRFEDNGIYE